jgi:putative transposase
MGFSVETLELMRQIDKVFTQYPFFGSRQIAAYLPRKGYHAGRHRVRRLMKVMGLEAIYKRPNTSKKHSENRIYPYLLRNMQITRANQVGCADITYIPVKRGVLYLVAIMDWATRKVLSWRLSNTMDASFCKEALDEAIAKYGPPEIMNTDQGSQFTGSALDHHADRGRGENIHGWARALFGQYIHRTPLAVIETGGRVLARVNRWFCGRTGDQRVDHVL